MRGFLTSALVIAFAAQAYASAPDRSVRPHARGVEMAAAPAPMVRPHLRPERVDIHAKTIFFDTRAVREAEQFGDAIVLASAGNMFQSLRPSVRPKGLEQQAMAKRRKRAEGAICGDPDLQGDVVGTVPGRIPGCGVKNAVRVRSVAGVGLTQHSTMDCGTAKALKKWIVNSAKPAVGNRGGGLGKLKVAAHFACRTRNNQKGAKISEHGKGRAIDISALILKDGRAITVLKGWRNKSDGPILKKVHKGACGPFGTVLGPNANKYHQDHFHFDTARYRSGSYCR